MGAFEKYSRGVQLGSGQGQNALMREQFIEKQDRKRKLQNILAGAYTAPVEASPAVGLVQPAVEAQPGGMDIDNAINAMYQGGFPQKAMELQLKRDSAGAGTREIMLKHQLKQEIQDDAFKRMAGIGGDGGMGLGYSMKVGPQGPEMAYDPSKKAKIDLERAKHLYETGGAPAGQPDIPPVIAGLPPKMQAEIGKLGQTEAVKSKQKRIASLRDSASSRQAFLSKAEKFKEYFKTGKMSSGAWRDFAQKWIPGVWTEQGRLSEEFGAFAETAARAALKASGEIRPTDADVKGMKEAMFGVGRDETVNIQLLDDAIAQMNVDEQEYNTLSGKQPVQQPSLNIDDLVNKYAQ